MWRLLPVLALLGGVASAQPAPIEDTDWGEDAGDDWATEESTGESPTDVGWGEETGDDWSDEVATGAVVDSPSNWSLDGFLRSDTAVRTRRLGELPLAKARQSLDLGLRYKKGNLRLVAEGHGEYDAAYLVSREKYDSQTLKAYEWRLFNGEQFVSYKAGPAQLTAGRQIVAWGEGDVISVLDIINPRDQREPGVVDLDDLRLSVLASRVGYFVGDHRFEAMVVHESYFGERAPPLGEFSPLRAQLLEDPRAAALLGSKTLRYVDTPDRFDRDGQSYFLRWIYKGPGLDFGFYAASALDQQGVVSIDPTAALSSDTLDIVLDHRRYTLLGHSGATAVGSWLYKWELAGAINKVFNVGDTESLQINTAKGTLLSAMGGVTYTGFKDTQIGFEAAKSTFLDRPVGPMLFSTGINMAPGPKNELLYEVDAPQFALRFVRKAMRETLVWSGALTSFGLVGELGIVGRAEVSYAVRDGFKIGAGYVLYVPAADGENGPLTGIDKHDRLLGKLRWDFIAF